MCWIGDTRRKNRSAEQRTELTALAALSEAAIDTSDIPEVADWSQAVVGRFYRPLKEPVTLRLDADVLHWLCSLGSGYQTRINQLLREAMARKSTHKPR